MDKNIEGRRRTVQIAARSRQTRSQPDQVHRPARMRRAEFAAGIAVAVVGLALVTLIWMVTINTVQEQRTEVRNRAEQTLAGQAAIMAEAVEHELVLIDQSLTIIQIAWKADSKGVDLERWRNQMPALTEVADDLFISDENHIIRQDILPQAIGQIVGSAYVSFADGAPDRYEGDGSKSKESLLIQSLTGTAIDARQVPMSIVQPLDHPKGWQVGASYKSAKLTKLFAQSGLGYNPIVALIDTKRSALQAVIGPAARRSTSDLSASPLAGMMTQSPSGIWSGETTIDGVDRIHAFHRVGDRDLSVLVAASMTEVLAPADHLAGSAWLLAVVATALVVVIGCLLVWELYTIRSVHERKRDYNRNKTELERLRFDVTTFSARSHLDADRVRVLIDNVSDGVALFDPDDRLISWNYPFGYCIGTVPRQNMPLDTLLREQAAAGLFARASGIETEIARRVGLLRTGDLIRFPHPACDQEDLILHGLPLSDGGLILILHGEPIQPSNPTFQTDKADISASGGW